jgi:hypothetical protein
VRSTFSARQQSAEKVAGFAARSETLVVTQASSTLRSSVEVVADDPQFLEVVGDPLLVRAGSASALAGIGVLDPL